MDENARDLARLDRMLADLRQHQADIAIIAEHGLPKSDDDGAAKYHDLLVKQMACAVLLQLNIGKMEA